MIKKIFIVLSLVFSILLCSIPPVYAESLAEDTGSNVLSDLKKDSSFDVNQYPSKTNDHSLNLITIGESSDRELLVYVYQPYSQVTYYANYIRLSETIDDEISPSDYKLTFLNRDGVFYKYKVDGFTVKTDDVRYYSVIALYRPFIPGIDQQAQYDNTISAVPFSVNKQYKFSTINGVNSVSCLDIETIVISDKLVGHVVHTTDEIFRIKYTYMHFVAFKCDHDIDDLLEADVSFITQAYHKNNLSGYDYREPTKNDVTLYAENAHELRFGFGKTQLAQWNEIESVDSFISNNDINSVYSKGNVDVYQVDKLTEEAKDNLRNMDWVLQFYQVDETTLRQIFGPAAGLTTDHEGVNVTDVTILRLKFITNGVIYNLGVIDNHQTGSESSSNISTTVFNFKNGSDLWDTFLQILKIVGLVILIVVLLPILPYIFKFLFALISLPIKGIKAIAKASKKSKEKG